MQEIDFIVLKCKSELEFQLCCNTALVPSSTEWLSDYVTAVHLTLVSKIPEKPLWYNLLSNGTRGQVQRGTTSTMIISG